MNKCLPFIFLLLSTLAMAQKSSHLLPIIRASSLSVDIREDKELRKNAWTITPKARPDVHSAAITGKSKKVTFITDMDSISFTVKPGRKYDFVILYQGRDSAYTRIEGVKQVKPASFSRAYKKAYDGITFAEIPEVYELVNILFSITPTYQKEKGAVSRSTGYYREVMQKFEPYLDQPAVKTMDSLVRNAYFVMKMDAYAYHFNRTGKIVQSKVYDRISWGNQNTLRPYLPLLQAFSDHTGFREFYTRHQAFYNRQIAGYRDSVGVPEMVSWLRRNFPGSNYNSFKIIWSPLTGYNQSANWFEDNGFKEMQAHVNFPYRELFNLPGVSAASNELRRGDIVFTEVNHSFINPEGDKQQYEAALQAAFKDLDYWAQGIARSSYGNVHSCFNEYMNWALVPLRYIDYAPKEDFDRLQQNIDVIMVKNRGFKRFAEFDHFLSGLYRTRRPGTTVADLYPQIVAWFVDEAKKGS